jgi:hypothetical protein
MEDALKLVLGLTAVLLTVMPALAAAECKGGDQIKLSGTIIRLFANAAKGWTLEVGGLNSEFVECVPDEIMGQKTPSGAWYPLFVSKKPAANCKSGSHVDATMTISEELMGNTAKVAQWTCE